MGTRKLAAPFRHASSLPGQAYRAPEAWLCARQFLHDRTVRYRAGPADDLYALGVTAYRLVTGEYPELAEPARDEAGIWHLNGLASPAPLVLNPRVSPQLDGLILRMLSMHCEQRGSAAELAGALEQAAALTSPESTRSLFVQASLPSAAEASALRPPHVVAAEVQAAEVPSLVQHSAGSVRPVGRTQPWRLRLATAAAILVLGCWAGWGAREKFPEQPAVIRQEAGGAQQEDEDTTGLGDDAAAASTGTFPSPSAPGVLAQDTPPEPLPGQVRPDAKGRCPNKQQLSLNGGCWVETPLTREKCEALKLSGHDGYMFKGACYMPVLPPGRQPTSQPVHKP